MFSIIDFKKRKTLVAGLGKSGICALKLLHSKGFDVKGCDRDKNILENPDIRTLIEKGIEIEISDNFETMINNSDLIVLSPGIDQRESIYKQAQEKGKTVTGELEAAWSFIEKPVTAITGTNGKSTVTELTADMLLHSGKKVFRGGNLGTPLSAAVSDQDKYDVFILEVSSFQIDTSINFSPNVGLILNITPDHLDRYENFEDYKKSKLSLFKNFNTKNTAITNYNEALDFKTNAARSYFNTLSPDFNSAAADEKTLQISFNQETQSINLKKFRLKGSHNYENLSAAAITALESGANIEGIKKAVDTFNPLPHRMEYIGSIDNVSFIDDSKATNPDSVIKAVEGLDLEISLILGGKDKGYDYGLMSEAVNNKVKNLILIGEAAEKINRQINFKGKTIFAPSMKEAVEKGFENLDGKGYVLLSPACSSFDMFKNYGHRGEVFKNSFKDLKRSRKA
ncbi:MAG: UDP-N-acetylmuramoyl-L-alanine--D-glutamate ligase [Desulfobacteraceae bacterium]|nr:UDP-N-acetylmuramoyl-L-alanine--D-glutamate ligase [Desulfobacteraceae bacterium]MCB9494509.1 UDP-N-acetylmuramoyl-L-alanine--D-glutamate ligase [Desulfobacteraceae bacterium]